ARAILRVSIEEQLSLTSVQKDSFINVLRSKFEAAGILVARNSALSHFGGRGMCLYATPLPLIVFSTEAPNAQAFTLAHELAHVALKLSAISGPPGFAAPSAKRIEDWCNAFAAAFLIPANALARVFSKPRSPLAAIGDAELNTLGKKFAVSRHAMLVRLVNLGYVRA